MKTVDAFQDVASAAVSLNDMIHTLEGKVKDVEKSLARREAYFFISAQPVPVQPVILFRHPVEKCLVVLFAHRN